METRGAEKRNRNPSYLSGYVFPPSVLARFYPSLRQAFVEIKLPLLSSIPLSLPSTLKSSLNSLFLRFLPVSTLLTLRFHPFPPFFFSSRNAFSSFPFNTRFLRVPSACLHLGILSRFCRRAKAKFVFERVPGFEGMEGRRMSNDLIAGFPCQTIINLLRCKYCCFNLSVRRLKKKKKGEKKKTFCPFN